MAQSTMDKLMARLEALEQALRKTKEDVAAAEARAARAEARAARLETTTGNLAAAVVNPKPITRRSLLTKAAVAGAAGVAGALVLNRPKDVFATFSITGGAINASDGTTTLLTNSGVGTTPVFRADANQGANPNTNIDGVLGVGSNGYSGLVGYGGNHGGAGIWAVGGPATGTGASGLGGHFYAGTTASGQYANQSIQAYQQNNQTGVYTYNAVFGAAGASNSTSLSNGLWSYGADQGWGLYGSGGGGIGTAPNATNGGHGSIGYAGPGQVGVVGYGDTYYNPTLGSHGTAGFGNAVGVGGWFVGGRAALALGSAGSAGPPATGAHFRGDVYLDVKQVAWICIADGTPGTFEPLQPGGMNNALWTAVSTQQYTLSNSDGATWMDMDATNLKLVVTPTYSCQAILTGSSDLWTANAGFNQDIGIAVSGGVYPTSGGQPEAWKESGGFAGTFSPNAAHVDTIIPLAAGTAYTIKLQWKTNKGGSSLIAAGAGPIALKFSPTRLTAQLIATKPGGGPIASTAATPYEIPAEMRPDPRQRQRPGSTTSPYK